jgi:hypothetical protein
MRGLLKRNRRSPAPWAAIALAMVANHGFAVASPGDESREFLVWHCGESEIRDQAALWAEFRHFLGRGPEDPAKVTARIRSLEEISRILGPGIASPGALADSLAKLKELSENSEDQGQGCRDLLASLADASRALDRRLSLDSDKAPLLRRKQTLLWNVATERRRQSENGGGRKGRAQHQSHPLIGSSLEEVELQRVTAEIQLMETDAADGVRLARKNLQELSVELIRRGHYREAILAARFYRALFGELMVTLRVEGKIAEILMPEGITPTLHDVEGVARRSLEFVDHELADTILLLKAGVIEGATAKLAGAYALGSRMPEFLSFPADDRKKVLLFLDLQRDLKTHLAASDSSAASADLFKIRTLARDFNCASADAELAALKASRIPQKAQDGNELPGSESRGQSAHPATNAVTPVNSDPVPSAPERVSPSRNSESLLSAGDPHAETSGNLSEHPLFAASLDHSSGMFARRMNRARLLESGSPVDALMIYLELRELFPVSRLAREGVDRVSRRLLALPDPN